MKFTVMSHIYKQAIKPLLFRMDPESAHDRFIRMGHVLGRYSGARHATSALFRYEHPSLSQKLCGLKFKNPVGLSAGFDKNGDLTQIMEPVGFGFMQVGTLTLHAYAGNPKPRAVRLPHSQALVVNYGLKNIGVEHILPKLNTHTDFPIGVSVGKTNCYETADVNAGILDYASCLYKVIQSGAGDFYTINISCPNTFGGEPFITSDRLDRLLTSLFRLKIEKPVFLKMPIHLAWNNFKPLLDVAVAHGVDGVIIGNLCKDRHYPLIKDALSPAVKGGISGKPTWDASNELISQAFENYRNQLLIVGVGGIFSAADAYEKIKRGASLVQLITGMIYEGPQLIGSINKGLVQLLRADGYKNISDAIGAYHK